MLLLAVRFFGQARPPTPMAFLGLDVVLNEAVIEKSFEYLVHGVRKTHSLYGKSDSIAKVVFDILTPSERLPVRRFIEGFR